MLLWLLHQKGLFDPLYDWWEDIFGDHEQFIVDQRKFEIDKGHRHIRDGKHHRQERGNPNHGAQLKRKTSYDHKHKHSKRNSDYFDHLHHVPKEIHKHQHKKNMDIGQHIHHNPAHHKRSKEQNTSKGLVRLTKLKHDKARQKDYDRHEQVPLYEPEAE